MLNVTLSVSEATETVNTTYCVHCLETTRLCNPSLDLTSIKPLRRKHFKNEKRIHDHDKILLQLGVIWWQARTCKAPHLRHRITDVSSEKGNDNKST